MIRKLKHIISFVVLLAFFWPTVVKLQHHHLHHDCEGCCSSNSQSFHEKCEVCNFEFSFFSADAICLDLEKDKPTDSYSEGYQYNIPATFVSYSFLLRAPPFC